MTSETLNACTVQLIKEYSDICWRYKVNLRRPLIEIVEVRSFLGRWNPTERKIELTTHLLLSSSWDDVCSVLKHEMAHQMVSELYGSKDATHGEEFHRAGQTLGLSEKFLRAQTELSPEIPPDQEASPLPILLRIEKLLSLAQSQNEHEASLAMRKAQDLIAQHNLNSLHAAQRDPLQLKIIETHRQKISALCSRICGLLMEFYFVDIVIGESFDISKRKKTKTIEIFGRSENVKIAEYVYHFLVHCVDTLWENYAQTTKTRGGLKKSYTMGLIVGFENKLREAERERTTPDLKALIPLKGLLHKEQKDLKNFIKKRHPRLSRRSRGRQMYDERTFARGLTDGKKIVVHKGMSSAVQGGIKLLKNWL
ncbi:MAG: SprT-like domain-containing protein [Bdellovibrionales bacterium]|nr:SprT-like domain-containing protein [Bdellovibrionales bacterium]